MSKSVRSLTGAQLVVLAACALVVATAGSSHKNFIQANILPMSQSLTGGDVSHFAWATTLFALMIAFTSPVAGFLADRYGAATALLFGTGLSGFLFLGYGMLDVFGVFLPSYGLLGALAFGLLSYVPLAVLVDEAFDGRSKGLVYAALTNGPAIGFIVLAPLWLWLAQRFTWQSVSVGIGATFLLVLTPIAARLATFVPRSDARGSAERTSFGASLATLLKCRPYVMLTLAFMGCGITMAFIDVHMVPDLQMQHVPAPTTSLALAILGVTEIAGSILAGVCCDRGWVKSTLLVGYALRGGAMLLIALWPTAPGAVAFGAVFGLSYLMTVIATTLWVLRVSPPQARGTGVGALWSLHSLGAALSSQIGAHLAHSTGSYRLTSLLAAAAVALSFVIVSLVKAPTPVELALEPAEELV